MKQEKRAKLSIAIVAAIAATLLTQTTAYALTFTMNPGEHYAWVVKINNGNWIITEDANRNCVRTYHLGNPALTENLTLNGTISWDYIQVWKTTGNASFCGAVHQVSPPTLNGFYLDVVGGNDNDVLSPANSLDAWALGGEGHDTIFSASGYSEGGPGNDTLFASSTSDVLYGNEGDDSFCLDRYHAKAWIASGGPGTNKGCGVARFTSSVKDSCPSACLP
jgi:Ca2+-binding RTX toxin-like protein